MLHNSGIDWLTVTTPKEITGLNWYELFRTRAMDLKGQEVVEPWQNKFYVGQMVGRLRWGYSSQNKGYILIASGNEAEYVWSRVVPSAMRVTRMDLQVTILVETPIQNLTQDLYKKALENSPRRNLSYTQIMSSRGGNTLYVGSRQSEFFGRVYDKGIESGSHPKGHLWRYEVEIKSPKGKPIAGKLLTDFVKGEATKEAIRTYVFHWFANKAVKPIFKCASADWSKEIGVKIETSAEKKLEWLHTQVRPTVHKLLSMGRKAEIEKALGVKVEQMELTL